MTVDIAGDAALASSTESRAQMRNYYGNFAFCSVASFVAAFVFYYAVPGQRHLLLEEDSLLETMSALSYLAAAILAFVIARKNHPARRALWFIGAVALVGFLDELSFGERLFNLQMPVIRGKKIDAVHDVVSLAFRLTREFPLIALPLLAVAGIAFLTIAWKQRKHFLSFVLTYRGHPALRFFAVFAAMILAALVIDLGLKNSDGLYLLEELFELNAGLALGFCAWSLRSPPPSKTP
jgi:hypothetical protein